MRRLKSSCARALLSLLCIVAGGCPVGPDFVRPEVPLNADWTQKGDQRIATQTPTDQAWWKAFHDPVLDRLVELAYRQNLPLQVSGIRILEARAQLGIAIGRQLPTNQNPIATGGGGGIYNEHGANGNNLNLYYGQYQVGFDVLWEVDFWGKYRRGVKAAKAGYLATIADYDDALVALTAEVSRTYLLIRTYEVLIALTQENATLQEEGQRIAQARFKNGATSELDVAQATALLETTRATIPELQLSLQQSENALCTLLGQPSGCARPLLGPAALIPALPAQIAVSVPAELLRRRPDIRSAELNAVAQCDRIGVAKADLFPSFVLLGSIGTRTVGISGAPNTVQTLTGLFNPGTLLYSLGASIFWPILNYPKILNNVRVEDARFQQSLVSYVNIVLKAAQEVEDGIAGVLREEEATAFSENAVAASQSAVKLSFIQYREGAVDYQRVLDAERALLTSQTQLARTRSAAATNLVSLYKALGGGWELRQGQPVVPQKTQKEMQKRTNWGSYFDKPPPPPPRDGQR
jgi:NodT family efflux transporter outer membrane factor (OMF) lipoprotein